MQYLLIDFLLVSLLFALPGLVLSGDGVAESGQTPGWQVTNVKQKGWNDRPDRGLIMYTTGVRETGAAFRCYLKEMSAFLLNEPTDVVKQVLDVRRRGTDLAVGYSIDGGAEITAHWRRYQGSRIYEARGASSVKDVFLAATGGATIVLTPKFADTVTFSMHEAAPELVRAFLEACDLKRHLYR